MKISKTIRIKRYLPEKPAPFSQTYSLPVEEELTVLDALNMIKDQQDQSLAFRWSCRMGICGSCAAVVNGKPVLMCQTALRELAEICIEPLRNFPVVKDLVVDYGDAFEKLRRINPQIARMKKQALEDGEMEQTPAQMEKFQQAGQCIKCMLCYSACPVFGQNRNFMGPAAGALAYRYAKDSRNEKPKRQIQAAAQKDGMYGCSFVGECSVVCPKRVDPAVALQRLKLMGALTVIASEAKQ